MDLKQKLKALQQERKQVVEEQQALNDRAIAENRDLTGDEMLKYNKMDERFEQLTGQIDLLREQIDRQPDPNFPPELKSEIIHDDNYVPPIRTMQGGIERRSRGDNMKLEKRVWAGETAQYAKDDNGYVWNPEATDHRNLMNTAIAFGLPYVTSRFGPSAIRALKADQDSKGGFLVSPYFAATLIKTLDERLPIRQLGRKFTVETTDQLDFPTLEADPGDYSLSWTAELLTGSEDSSMQIGQRSLKAHPLARRIKISNKLMRISAIAPEELVRERLAYVFEQVLEYNYLQGDGVNGPLGIFVANNAGVDTDRDISSGNTSTVVKYAGLVNAKGHLKPQYRKRAVWIMHRDLETKLESLLDGEGRPIWREGLAEGAPNRLLGYPIILSEHCPNTFSASQYVAVLCDPSFYWIFDSLQFNLQILHELYAETAQTGIIARYCGDAAPMVSEAFVRVQLGA